MHMFHTCVNILESRAEKEEKPETPPIELIDLEEYDELTYHHIVRLMKTSTQPRPTTQEMKPLWLSERPATKESTQTHNFHVF